MIVDDYVRISKDVNTARNWPGGTKANGESMEQGPLSLVSTTEELLVRKSSGSDLENRDYSLTDPQR
jgi:hypothetical protein